MGAKYQSNSATGYNSSPPSDDGAQTAANLITWAKHKTKLSDPVKTLAEDINTDLVAAFDYAVRQINASDSVVAGDHMRTVEISPTVSSAVTVTLADAATMTNVFIVRIKNSSPDSVGTIARATGGDTIDGVAANISIPPKTSYIFTTNNAANGYLIVGSHPLEVLNLTEEETPAVSDTVAFYDLSLTRIKKLQLDKLLKFINGLTEDTAPNDLADYLVTYDASASSVKKVLPQSVSRVPSGAGKNIAARTHASTPNSQLTISADEIVVRDTNGRSIVLSSVSVNPAITASGANGLDTGTEAGNTWYYGWVIYNPTTATTAGLISASSSAPTMPSGYTFKALVSAVRNDGSSNFVAYKQQGATVFYNNREEVLASGAATTETAVSVSSVVPPVAHTLLLNIYHALVTANGSGVILATLTLRHTTNVDAIRRTGDVVYASSGSTPRTCPILGTVLLPNVGQQFFYLWTVSTGSSPAVTIDLTGFTLPLGGE